MITTEDNELIFKEGWSRVEVLDLARASVTPVTDQEWRSDHPSPFGWIEDLAWSGDSQAWPSPSPTTATPRRSGSPSSGGDGWDLQLVDPPGHGDLRRRSGLAGRPAAPCATSARPWGASTSTGPTRSAGGSQGKTQVLAGGDIVVGAFDFDAKGQQPDRHLRDHHRRQRRLRRQVPEKFDAPDPRQPPGRHLEAAPDPARQLDRRRRRRVLRHPGTARPATSRTTAPCPRSSSCTAGPPPRTKYRLRLWIYGRALMASQGLRPAQPQLPRVHRLRRRVPGETDRPGERDRGDRHRRRHALADRPGHRRSRHASASWAGATAAT